MNNETIKLPSNRSFGIIFFIVFLIIALWPLKYNGDVRIIPICISLIFLILGLFNSNLLKPLNFLWMKFGLMLGKIIAPIVMMIIFFIFLTPMSFIVKLFGKDLLQIKFIKNNSYWIIRKKDIGPMKKQF